MWVLRMWASNDESKLSISHTGQALLECDGYEMILTKARKPLTHLAKSQSFDQETILTMSAMSLVSSLLLHFSRRKRLIVSCNLVFNLSCRWSDFFIWFRVRAGKLILRRSLFWMRQTNSMSFERATRVLELIVSDESVIWRRKQKISHLEGLSCRKLNEEIASSWVLRENVLLVMVLMSSAWAKPPTNKSFILSSDWGLLTQVSWGEDPSHSSKFTVLFYNGCIVWQILENSQESN